jgi:hypothetical protein
MLLAKGMRVIVWACVLAAGLFGCGTPYESFDGKVLLRGRTDHSGILVFVSGSHFSEDSIKTGPTGDWHFRIATNGARYFVKAYAPSTLEQTQEIVVDVGDEEDKVAPDMVFTPIGGMRGQVQSHNAPVEGARVTLEGTDLGATTDGAGAFVFDTVREGTYTVRVVVDGHAPVTTSVAVDYATSTPVPPIDVP